MSYSIKLSLCVCMHMLKFFKKKTKVNLDEERKNDNLAWDVLHWTTLNNIIYIIIITKPKPVV